MDRVRAEFARVFEAALTLGGDTDAPEDQLRRFELAVDAYALEVRRAQERARFRRRKARGSGPPP